MTLQGQNSVIANLQGRRIGDSMELMDRAQRREVWRGLAESSTRLSNDKYKKTSMLSVYRSLFVD
jgi:hypothetical protein